MSDRSAVRRLALGDFLSSTGSGIAAVALSFFVYQQTNSAIWLAGTLFFTFGVAGLITPFAGKIADRYDRRRVMIASDLLSLATWGDADLHPRTGPPCRHRLRRDGRLAPVLVGG